MEGSQDGDGNREAAEGDIKGKKKKKEKKYTL